MNAYGNVSNYGSQKKNLTFTDSRLSVYQESPQSLIVCCVCFRIRLPTVYVFKDSCFTESTSSKDGLLQSLAVVQLQIRTTVDNCDHWRV